MEKVLNRASKRVRVGDKASAFGGILKILQWMIWALAKGLSRTQVELTKVDGAIASPDSPKKVYRATKNDALDETNLKIREVEVKLERATVRLTKAGEENKMAKYTRYSTICTNLESELIQLDRVMRALR